MILSRPTPGAASHGDHAATTRSTASEGIVAPRAGIHEQSWRTTPVSQALRLSVERPASGVVVVVMDGEIDLASMPRLTELVQQRLTAASLRALVLDLSAVSFVSSCGLELLLRTQRRAEQRGIALYVVAGSRPVWRLLQLTGQAERFTRRGSVAEAVAEAQG